MQVKTSRAQIFNLVDRMVDAAPCWSDRPYKFGYFDGLTAGWRQAGFISQAEMEAMRARLRATQPAWWNIAGWLGLLLRV